jgi:hypothetical protein
LLQTTLRRLSSNAASNLFLSRGCTHNRQPNGGAASLQKRAIQFGSRIAKLSSVAYFGAARKGVGGASAVKTHKR